jgi:YidC/Oxa1 family membrane protein insertase
MWDTLIIEPFLNVLLLIYQWVGANFGLAIILFTILIRLVTYPLTTQQMKSSQKMQEMQNSEKWKAIQKKYKDDREKLAQEQMKLYKEMGFNPLAPCLPTLIQFPIIIGLYQSITRALAVTPLQLLDFQKHVYENFVDVATLIPLNSKFLWMDLSQPERVYLFGFGIPVLAIVVVVTTYLQSKLMTPMPSAGNPSDQTAQMTRMMNLYMPLFMGYIAYTLVSGLALYFVISNVAGIAQYAVMGKLDWRNLIPGMAAVGKTEGKLTKTK